MSFRPFFQPWHKGKEGLKLIRVRYQYDHSDGKSGDVLLEREIPINRDEGLKLRGS